MRENEDLQTARLKRLECELSGAPHQRLSRANSQTARPTSRGSPPLEPSIGGQVYPSFPPPPPIDDVSSLESALSTLSSLSAASRGQRAESADQQRQQQEKENSEEDEDKRRSRNTNSVSGNKSVETAARK